MLGGDVGTGSGAGKFWSRRMCPGGQRMPRESSATSRPRGPRVHSLFDVLPDLQIGPSSVHFLPDGRYAVRAHAHDEAGKHVRRRSDRHAGAARVFPGRRHRRRGTLPPATPSQPSRRTAPGSVCEGAQCAEYRSAQAYHDHNWGVWRGVTWDWGAARAGNYALPVRPSATARLPGQHLAAVPLPRRLPRLPGCVPSAVRGVCRPSDYHGGRSPGPGSIDGAVL